MSDYSRRINAWDTADEVKAKLAAVDLSKASQAAPVDPRDEQIRVLVEALEKIAGEADDEALANADMRLASIVALAEQAIAHVKGAD